LSPLHIYAGEKKKIKVKFLANVFPWIKLSPFDAELNSESNGLILMDTNSFWREKFALGHQIWIHICLVVLASHRHHPEYKHKTSYRTCFFSVLCNICKSEIFYSNSN
jgi:hypothetical protein